MRGAWNPTRDVVWRRINLNLFSIQFNCLADWNKAIHQGPREFRGSALIIQEYDGFSNPESVKLGRIETWAQIHKLPDGVLKKQEFVMNLARRIGEVQEVQIKLPNGFVGQFIRVRVKLDVNKKLTRFVNFSKGGKTEFFQVKYEKLPKFCNACGKLGHWHDECGTGEHDTSKFEWGPFILAPLRGRGTARYPSPGRGFYDGGAGVDSGTGRGRGQNQMRGRGFAGGRQWNTKYTNPGFESSRDMELDGNTNNLDEYEDPAQTERNDSGQDKENGSRKRLIF